jgi:predicted N-acetyltransferase YhbS
MAPSISPSVRLDVEDANDGEAVEVLLDRAIGPVRHERTAADLRRGSRPVEGLSLVARRVVADDPGVPVRGLLGTVRHWPIVIGEARCPAVLLGPLAVDPDHKGTGIGSGLVKEAIARARALGHARMLLIGDPAYYGRFGFSSALTARLTLPRPEAPERVQGLALQPGAFDGLNGLVTPA